MENEKRKILKLGSMLVWSTPVVGMITLPSHAQTSSSICVLNDIAVELVTDSTTVSISNRDQLEIDVTFDVSNIPEEGPGGAIVLDLLIDFIGSRSINVIFGTALDAGSAVRTIRFDVADELFPLVDTATTFTNLSILGLIGTGVGGTPSGELCSDRLEFDVPINLTVMP